MTLSRTLLVLCLLSPDALACDTSPLRLSGSAAVETCHEPDSPDCIYAARALHAYLEAIPDTDALYSVGLQSSPWRMYDGEMRILTVEDLASAIRPKLGEKRWVAVELIGSWTGVSTAPGMPSLADRVSQALEGFPVKGEDGFLWLAEDGTRRTTRQAYTVFEGAGAYHVPKGGEVLAPLAAGWPAFVEDRIPEDDAEMLMRAAAGWDLFFLCPDRALAGFEHAAGKGSPIAAYNAALMRLERDAEGDRAAALALLERGAALGDAKSKVRLDAERLQAR